METVWAICWNGPAQGTVEEVSAGCTIIEVSHLLGDTGRHEYRRVRWGGTDKSHRIAIFQWTKTLVV